MYSLTVDALTKLAKQLCPPGTVQAFAGFTAPIGFVHCNGQELSRIDYPELYSVIGTAYGSGDGSTTFNVPDYRGYFLRGWNNTAREDNTDDSTPLIDPDAESREARPDGTNGNNIGTVQNEQDNSPNKFRQTAYNNGSRQVGSGSAPSGDYNIPHSGWSGEAFTGDAQGSLTTWQRHFRPGNETRPKNISVMYIIKT